MVDREEAAEYGIGICDNCGRDFERYEYDHYAEAQGVNPITDHLEGQTKGYVCCPECLGGDNDDE